MKKKFFLVSTIILITSLLIQGSLHARESFVDKPTPMEWYRGCTTTAISILLDWFGDHGYWNLYGEPRIATFQSCENAYIREDIADLYADHIGLNCTNRQGASPEEIETGIEAVLESNGYCVNEDRDECFQLVNHMNLQIQDLINSIDNGFPLTLGVDSSTLRENFDFDNDFDRSINHRVIAYGYTTENNRIRINLLTGWSRDWEDATREIVISGDSDTEIQERALYITPPYSDKARMITRASSLKRIFDHFDIPSSFGLDSYFYSSFPSDVDTGTSYYKYIATAYNKNIVHGYTTGELAGKYGAFYSVNRVEFLKMVMETLNTYFDLPLESSQMQEPVNIFGNRFPDMNYNSWYYKYVKAADHYGIIQGTQDGKLNPGIKLSETEAKLILDRAKQYAVNANSTSTAEYIDKCINKFSDYFGNKIGNSYSCYSNYLCQNTTGGNNGTVTKIAIHKKLDGNQFYYYWNGWGSLDLSSCQ